MKYLCAKHAQYYDDYCPYCGNPIKVVTTSTYILDDKYIQTNETEL